MLGANMGPCWHSKSREILVWWQQGTAGKAPGRAPETHYIEIFAVLSFELEIRQNVSQVERNILTKFQPERSNRGGGAVAGRGFQVP